MKLCFFSYHVMAVWFMAQCTVTWSISSVLAPTCQQLHDIRLNNSSVFAAPSSGSQAGGEGVNIRIHLLIGEWISFLQARKIEDWISYQLDNSSLLQAWNDETAVNISSIKFRMYLPAMSGPSLEKFPDDLDSFAHLAGITILNDSTWEKLALAILSQSAEHDPNQECYTEDEVTFHFSSTKTEPTDTAFITNSCPRFLKGPKPCKKVNLHWNNICNDPQFYYLQRGDTLYFNYTHAWQDTLINVTTSLLVHDKTVLQSNQFNDTFVIKENSNKLMLRMDSSTVYDGQLYIRVTKKCQWTEEYSGNWIDHFDPKDLNIILPKVTPTSYGNYEYFVISPNESAGVAMFLKNIYDEVEKEDESFWTYLMKSFGASIRREGISEL